jgi:hypothetical protein
MIPREKNDKKKKWPTTTLYLTALWVRAKIFPAGTPCSISRKASNALKKKKTGE